MQFGWINVWKLHLKKGNTEIIELKHNRTYEYFGINKGNDNQSYYK